MPLIKCLMCEKMISPNAKSCPNCGEPMKNRNISIDISKDISIDKEHCSLILEDAGYQKIVIIKRVREVTGWLLPESKNSVDNTPSIILKDISYSKAEDIKSTFEILGAKMKIVSTNDPEMVMENIGEMRTTVKSEINTKNKILCLNCKSEKVHKISGLSKAGSAVLFGVFSLGKLNKTYECDSCGYRW